MTNQKKAGKIIRWGLFALWVLCLGVGIYMFFFGGPDNESVLMGTPSYFLSYLLYFSVL